MKIDADRPKDLAKAYSKYYDRLADHFVQEIGPNRTQTLLEAGCGRGQLTIPLLKNLPRTTKLILVDSSKGPYAGWLNELTGKIRRRGLDHRVRIVNSDVRQLKEVESESVDGIVSNELICDLPRKTQLKKALEEFHRILRPRGIMVHGEWTSTPTHAPKALMIRHSPSWTPDQLFVLMRDSAFRDFHVTYFDTTIHLGYANAVEELRTWGWTDRMLKQNEKMLRREGMDLPLEHVISCKKGTGSAY